MAKYAPKRGDVRYCTLRGEVVPVEFKRLPPAVAGECSFYPPTICIDPQKSEDWRSTLTHEVFHYMCGQVDAPSLKPKTEEALAILSEEVFGPHMKIKLRMKP